MVFFPFIPLYYTRLKGKNQPPQDKNLGIFTNFYTKNARPSQDNRALLFIHLLRAPLFFFTRSAITAEKNITLAPKKISTNASPASYQNCPIFKRIGSSIGNKFPFKIPKKFLLNLYAQTVATAKYPLKHTIHVHASRLFG